MKKLKKVSLPIYAQALMFSSSITVISNLVIGFITF